MDVQETLWPAALHAGARAFDLLEWRSREHLTPYTSFAAGHLAGLCIAPLEEGAPDAWLRWAAVHDGAPLRLLQELIDAQVIRLRGDQLRTIWAVDLRGSWLNHALRARGFGKVDEIVTYELTDQGAAQLMNGQAPIVEAVEAHIAALASVDARAFAAPWRYPAFVLSAALSALDAASVFAVATGAGRPIGYVLAIARGAEAHVVRLAVDPEHGRRGVGSALLQHAITRLRAAGVMSVTLNTLASLPAGRLYRRLGFAPLRIGVDVLCLML